MCHVSDSHLRKEPGTDLEGSTACILTVARRSRVQFAVTPQWADGTLRARCLATANWSSFTSFITRGAHRASQVQERCAASLYIIIIIIVIIVIMPVRNGLWTQSCGVACYCLVEMLPFYLTSTWRGWEVNCSCCKTVVVVQFSSVQIKMVSMCSEKPVCAPTRLSEVSPTLSLKRFQCSSDCTESTNKGSWLALEHFTRAYWDTMTYGSLSSSLDGFVWITHLPKNSSVVCIHVCPWKKFNSAHL